MPPMNPRLEQGVEGMAGEDEARQVLGYWRRRLTSEYHVAFQALGGGDPARIRPEGMTGELRRYLATILEYLAAETERYRQGEIRLGAEQFFHALRAEIDLELRRAESLVRHADQPARSLFEIDRAAILDLLDSFWAKVSHFQEDLSALAEYAQTRSRHLLNKSMTSGTIPPESTTPVT